MICVSQGLGWSPQCRSGVVKDMYRLSFMGGIGPSRWMYISNE